MKTKKAESGEWTGSSVGYIIRSETYAGVWHYGKDRIPLPVPPIVTTEQWQAAQAMTKQNVIMSDRNTKQEYLLRGRVVGECGFALRCSLSHSKNKTFMYYSGYRAPSDNRHTCEQCYLWFRADYTDALVWDWLKNWLKDPSDLRRKLKAFNAEQDEVNAPILSLIKANDDLIAENKVQLDRLLDLYLGRKFDKDILIDREARLRATITKLEEKCGELSGRLAYRPSDNEIENVMRFAYDLSAGIEEADESFEKRRAIIEILDVRAVMKEEDGERVCYPSFILSGKDRRDTRLVLPNRGESLSIATTSIRTCQAAFARQME
jgi:hypothetical protein